MTMLALEFSSARRSAAVLDIKGHVTSASHSGSEPTTRAFALIEEVLRRAGTDRNAIDCIAVGLGPGSYTGVRVAISIAQGWQLGRGVKLLGISSADAIAEGARGTSPQITCVIDAQRQEYYVAVYATESTPARVIEPLHIETFDQVKQRAERGETLAGPEEGFVNSRVVFPDAGVLAQLAASRTNFVPGEKLEPIYLREANFVKAPPSRFLPITS
jgi:tRNA threonylcarbamoyladenosine biosynthesis protein TsaB